MRCFSAAFALILAAGYAEHAGWPFTFVMLAAGAQLIWQVHTLEIERAQDLAPEHRRLEIRRVSVHRFDHQVSDLFAAFVPAFAVRQLRRDVLAEQARNVLTRRRETVVESGRNKHFDDGPLRPSAGLGVEIGLVHVLKTRRHDDTGGVMVGRGAPRKRSEVRQLR